MAHDTHETVQAACQNIVQSHAEEAHLKLEELKIPSLDKGIELNLRHKYNQTKESYTNKEIVLFLEPYSVPSAEAFDVPGYSWMDKLAGKGYDTWALDFRGFGKSTRPEAMSKPAQMNPPIIRATDAVKDLQAAVEYIKKTRGVDKINIVGWSWGAVVAGEYASVNSQNIQKLVLYGAMHGFSLPEMAKTYEAPDKPGQLNPKMPAYQTIPFEPAMHHWHMMLNGRDLVSEDAMKAVQKVFLASDPASETAPNHAIRRPMGPLVDLYNIWSNKPIFDASKITAPVLVIRGDSDFFADPTLINKLTNTKEKKEVVVSEATHWLMYENHRDQLFDETERFLLETRTTNPVIK
ncbi:alpha/beta hydrolase [Brevibacillus ginsengisoli]|uniref:alpha/beta hydrolase n=1 Tax=Brevibacillus ginsengisoli TaxID=363854 RepID=UPI003CEBDA99